MTPCTMGHRGTLGVLGYPGRIRIGMRNLVATRLLEIDADIAHAKQSQPLMSILLVDMIH